MILRAGVVQAAKYKIRLAGRKKKRNVIDEKSKERPPAQA
jgi:hypothetical protein